jgi:preprotein translocase subunit SecA
MLFTFDFLSSLRGQARPDTAAALARMPARLAALAKDSDARLRERTDALRRHADPAEAIALVVESVRRSHGLAAYEVQLRAGLALAEGALVEMATGEGKTLVALLPAFCFGLRGRGAHVATVNSYLAERDAAFARPVFARLGLSVGLLREREAPTAKRTAYACDVTYGVATEFGFDYLRDQLTIRAAGRTEPRFHEILLRRLPPKPALVQRPLAFAVIDEADSVLLDEARSPLIIAVGERRPSATPEVYRLADAVAGELKDGVHFTCDSRTHRPALTPTGERVAFARLDDATLNQLRRVWPQYLEHALHVRRQLRRDVHYVVQEGRVMIVDEFTGRLCPDRTWRDGLHQAVEARAGVTITEENLSEATISRPAYFQLYDRVCGMTGTAAEAAAELRASYQLHTVLIPPNRPCQRTLLPDRVFATRAAKHAAIAREVAARHAAGQPVLIGTRTIENSEALVDVLAPLGLTMRVLNAKQDADEAAIIELAGEPGMVTIATNMAGRGAHIPVPEESVRAGGLHVIGLERHESSRIDRQLIGRTGRQGQPGSAQFFLSLEDDLLQRHAPTIAARLAHRANAAGELPPKCATHFHRAQRKVEALDHAQRRALAAHHRWLDELKHAL